MPKIPTVALAGLWSAITVAALTVVAVEQSQPATSIDQTAALAIAQVEPSTPAAIHPHRRHRQSIPDASGLRAA